MATAAFTAVAAFEMIFLGKNLVTLGGEVIIFTLNEFYLFIFLHAANLKDYLMWWISSRFLLPRGFSGIAIFPFVLYRDARLRHNVTFVAHEKIHLRQQAELLILPFFLWYAIEFAVRWCACRDRRRAYHNISFEREAYANEIRNEYLQNRPFWNHLKYL